MNQKQIRPGQPQPGKLNRGDITMKRYKTRNSITLNLLIVALVVVVQSEAIGQTSTRDNRWLCDPAPNPDMCYIIRPNSDFITLGVPFRTNELGFRDRPIFEKSPSVFRILCLGDSITFGTGVANDQTFPNVLEAHLQANAAPGVVVDVINAGVSAYNTRNIRGLLETYLSHLRPDVVVYTFVENDLDDSLSVGPGGLLMALDPSRSEDSAFVMDDFSGLWMLRRNSVQSSGILTRLQGVFDNQFEDICALPPPLLVGDHPETLHRWRGFAAELDRMKTLCAQAQTPLLVYSFGLRGSAEPVVARLHMLCLERGLPHATTLPIFDYPSYTRTHSLGYDPHCNPLGHSLMADRLLAFLATESLLAPRFFQTPIHYNQYVELMDPAEVRRLEQRSLEAPARIDIVRAEGIIGVLGGIDVEGKMARTSLFRLGGLGNIIEIEVSPLFSSPETPQFLSAVIEGVPVSPPVLISGKDLVYSFPVPERLRGAPVEIELQSIGPSWIPSPEDRLRGASPQTLQIHRLARVQQSEAS